VTGDSAPEVLTAKADTVPEPVLVTKTKLAVGPCCMLLLPHPFNATSVISKDRLEKINHVRSWR
jgi:hypothetical protein